MKIYKPTYKDKGGKTKKCQHYYIDFTDNRGKRRKLPAFSNKRASEKAADKIEELLSSGGILSPDLQRWIENLPDKMRNNLVKFGLIDSQRVNSHIGKSLTEHVEDFCGSLLARGNNARCSKHVKSSLNFVFDGCGFKMFSDIDANTVYTFLAERRTTGRRGKVWSQRTFNCHLKEIQQFSRWMIRERRATSNPVEHLECIKQTEQIRKRRALSLDEQRRLLACTGYHSQNTGHQRAMFYRLQLETGMRLNETRCLAVKEINFDEGSITIPATRTKNKKDTTIVLRPQMTADLKSFTAGKMPDVRVFNLPSKPPVMLRRDLKSAGIEFETDEGRIDIHSLRHSFITNLARAGVFPADAMALARH